MEIVYIFGAGASASIDDECVPLMSNFFDKAIEMLNEDNKTFLIAFAFAEEARAFSHKPEVESLGIQMGVLGKLLEKSEQSKQSSFLMEELKDTINAYRAAFKSDINRTSANLEDVFSKVEAYKEKESKRAADQTYMTVFNT